MAIRFEDLPHYTYDDYKIWEGKWELIYGIPYAMSPSPSFNHQTISNKIARFLDEQLEKCENCHAILPFDWKIADDTVVQPDNMVVCGKPEHNQFLTKAPEIIFEILSKSSALKDRNTKFEIYQNEGVKYYIIVDQYDNAAKVYQLFQGKFVKQKDITKDNFHFELEDCQFDFDFSQIWP